MARVEKRFGERNNDDIIRDILREYSSRENVMKRSSYGMGSYIIFIIGRKTKRRKYLYMP